MTGMDMQGIASVIEKRTGRPMFGFSTTGNDPYTKGIIAAGSKLIIGDSVIAGSLRDALSLNGVKAEIVNASFFGLDKQRKPCDLHIRNEISLIKHLRSTHYDMCIADPLFKNIPELSDMPFCGIIHPAVSGKLNYAEMPEFLNSRLACRS